MLNFIKSFFTPQGEKTPTKPNFYYGDREGIVDEPIYPNRKGRIYYDSTWWPARCQEKVTLKPGEIVKIVHIENITVWVKPFSPP